MASDDLDEIRALMRRKRAEHATQVERLDAALRLLDRQLGDAPIEGEPNSTTPLGADRPHRSVRVKVLELLSESERDWNVAEIVREYERRGDPFPGSKPPSAVRTAIAKLFADKEIARTGQGRYIGRRWVGADPSPVSPNGAGPSSQEEERVG